MMRNSITTETSTRFSRPHLRECLNAPPTPPCLAMRWMGAWQSSAWRGTVSFTSVAIHWPESTFCDDNENKLYEDPADATAYVGECEDRVVDAVRRGRMLDEVTP